MNRSSHLLALGLALLLGGAVFLLYAFGVPAPEHLWRIWPLGLIAVGAAILARARRGAGLSLAGPERALLVLLALAGIATSFGFDDRASGRGGPRVVVEKLEPDVPLPPRPFDEPPAIIRSEEEGALTAGGILELEIRGATVELQPATGDIMTVQLATRGDAAPPAAVEVESSDGRALVRYLPRASRGGSGVRLLVAVPQQIQLRGNLTDAAIRAPQLFVGSCELDGSATDIEIARIDGSLKVNLDNGSIRIGSIGEEATITSTNSRLSLAEVGGPVTIRSSYGDVDLRRVRGVTDVEASFASVSAGSIESDLRVVAPRSRIRMFRLRANAHVETAHGSVQANSVRGDVAVTAVDSKVSLDDISGSIDVTSTRRPVIVARAHGTVKVVTSDSEVALRRCSGPIEVEANGGSLLLSRNRERVVARARDAHIDVDASRVSPVELEAERSTVRLSVAPRHANFSISATPGDIVVPSTSPLAASIERDGANARLSFAGGPVPIEVRLAHGLVRIVH